MPVEQRPIITVSQDNLSQITGRLSVGDLIFRHGTKTGVNATFIRNFQERVGKYPLAASNVTHVAVYSGEGRVIHAVPPRVCEEDFGHYFDGSKISAVTWTPKFCSREDAAKRIVAHMRKSIGRDYPSIELVRACMVEVARLHAHNRNLELKKKEQLAICSQIVFDSFDLVLDKDNPLHSGRVPQTISILVPAHIFMQPRLFDILLTCEPVQDLGAQFNRAGEASAGQLAEPQGHWDAAPDVEDSPGKDRHDADRHRQTDPNEK